MNGLELTVCALDDIYALRNVADDFLYQTSAQVKFTGVEIKLWCIFLKIVHVALLPQKFLLCFCVVLHS